MGIYKYEMARQLLKDRRRVLKAAWKAIEACAPDDLRPEPAPNAEQLLLEALELRAHYARTSENLEELLGNNILVENTRDLIR